MRNRTIELAVSLAALLLIGGCGAGSSQMDPSAKPEANMNSALSAHQKEVLAARRKQDN